MLPLGAHGAWAASEADVGGRMTWSEIFDRLTRVNS
jgi:hypothetical protein